MLLFELLKAAAWGLVEGVTEWLPISSTGHMILLDELIRLDMSEAFKDMFLVVIQLGAILAVALLFFKKLNPFSPAKKAAEKRDTMRIWYKIIIGVLPAAVLGFLFDDWFDAHFFNYQTVAVTLILYGVLFIVIENANRKRRPRIRSFRELTYKTAFFIGIFQVLSLVPGTSRSGATILGAILLGASRPLAAEFSFFLSVPIMFGASTLKLYKFGFDFTGTELAVLLTGMAVAFVVSVIVIRFLLCYIQRNDFKIFGWYRIVLGLLVITYFLIIGR